MKQKTLAIAVASAFALPVLPGVALAQVTISGKLGAQLTNVRVSNRATVAGQKTSETFVNDNTSILRFRMQENIGGGLTAFGQYEIRPALDGGSRAGQVNSNTSTPISYVGLRSSSWGELRVGMDTTWSEPGSGFSAGTSKHYSTSPILNYITFAGSTVSFSASRQTSVIRYTTPDFKNGFKVVGIYSSAPLSIDNDMAAGNANIRRGHGWYLMPEYSAGNWKIGWAHADIKTDTAFVGAAFADIKADKLWGEMKFGALDIGLTYAKVKADAVTAAGTTDAADVKKWMVPVRYRMGNHTFGAYYEKSGDDKVQAGDQAAKAYALTWNYGLSRRTNVGLTWKKLDNSAGAAFDISSTTNTTTGSTGSSAANGEDVSVLSLSLNHNF